MRTVEVRNLPANPIDAAGIFAQTVVAEVRTAIAAAEPAICLVFDPADHTHKAWRVAAVQALAREAAPVRVNAVAGNDEAAVGAATDYLAGAPGITGQYLPLDGQGAGNPAD